MDEFFAFEEREPIAEVMLEIVADCSPARRERARVILIAGPVPHAEWIAVNAPRFDVMRTGPPLAA